MDKKNSFDIKELFKNKEKAKTILMPFLLVVAGVLLVVLTKRVPTPQYEPTSAGNSGGTINELSVKNDASEELEAILGEIKGVGKVKVMITYSNSGKTVYTTDVNKTTDVEEQQENEGRSVTKRKEDVKSSVVFNGQKTPILEDRMAADIKGVLVVAEGGDDPEVRGQILRAVQVLTGVEAFEVAVCPYK